MSIKVMTLVWDRAPYEGNALVVLLALADWASEDGTKVYPSMQTLADKARISKRTAQRIVQQFESDGVLILVGSAIGGRAKTKEYKIDLERVQVCHPLSKGCQDEQERVTPVTEKGDTAMSPEPLVTVKEPLEEEGPSPEWAMETWNLLAEKLSLPRAQRLTDSRRARAKARLRDAGGREGWLYALSKVEGSDYLQGKINGWKADFDFLLRESKFTKVMEGAYDNGPGPPKDPLSAAVDEMLGDARG